MLSFLYTGAYPDKVKSSPETICRFREGGNMRTIHKIAVLGGDRRTEMILAGLHRTYPDTSLAVFWFWSDTRRHNNQRKLCIIFNRIDYVIPTNKKHWQRL